MSLLLFNESSIDFSTFIVSTGYELLGNGSVIILSVVRLSINFLPTLEYTGVTNPNHKLG